MLKAYLLFNGIEYQRTHKISVLIKQIAENDITIDADLSNDLEDMSETLLVWETESRYDVFTSFSQRKYERAVSIYERLDKMIEECIDSFTESEDNTCQDE